MWYRKLLWSISLTISVGLLTCTLALADDSDSEPEPQASAQTQTTPPQAPSPDTSSSDKWQVTVTPYLWFSGLQGTTGTRGHYLSIHLSPGDLLSNFQVGLMGAVEAQKGPWFLASDILWARLSNDKVLPFTEGPGATATLGAQEFFVTPMAGGRLLDLEHVKFDMYGGLRIWHLGQTLSFTPSILGLNPSSGQDWVDPLVGARFRFPLGQSKKVVVTAMSDVALFGVGSQTSYQFIGDLGYKVSRGWRVRAGYRYLKVDYTSGSYIYNTIQDGAIIGASYTFK